MEDKGLKPVQDKLISKFKYLQDNFNVVEKYQLEHEQRKSFYNEIIQFLSSDELKKLSTADI